MTDLEMEFLSTNLEKGSRSSESQIETLSFSMLTPLLSNCEKPALLDEAKCIGLYFGHAG